MTTPPTSEEPSPTIPCPFTIETFHQDSPLLHPILQTPTKDHVYLVRPQSIWASLTPFASFTCTSFPPTIISPLSPPLTSPNKKGSQHKYRLHDKIHVHHHHHHHHQTPTRIAHILEIKAFNSHHVYLRVYWFYRLHDVFPRLLHPTLRSNELLATDDMAIIHASSITGPCTVTHWVDDERLLLLPPPVPAEGYFWRRVVSVHIADTAVVERETSLARSAEIAGGMYGRRSLEMGGKAKEEAEEGDGGQ